MSLRAWLSIASTPALLFYGRQDSRPSASAACYPYLLEIGTIRRALNGENAHVTITLDNSRGQLTPLLATPPLRTHATLVLEDSGTLSPLLSGLIMSVRLGSTADLSIEA